MSQVVHGGGGIPRKGHEAEYATEMWLDDPRAFWLHPEGPLSETTPDEWRAKQPKPLMGRLEAQCALLAGLHQNAAPYQHHLYRNAILNPIPGQIMPLSPSLAGLVGVR